MDIQKNLMSQSKESLIQQLQQAIREKEAKEQFYLGYAAAQTGGPSAITAVSQKNTAEDADYYNNREKLGDMPQWKVCVQQIVVCCWF